MRAEINVHSTRTIQFVPHREQSASVIKTNWWMQNREICAVCCKCRADYKNKPYGENAQLSAFNLAVRIPAIGFNGFFPFFFLNKQSTRYSMSWCAGWLTWWGPLQRGDLLWIQSLLIEVLAPRRWGFHLKSKSTNYPDQCHHGDPPPIRKIPMVELGIEPGTSWLVARSSDH
jgi:hypothetical protein